MATCSGVIVDDLHVVGITSFPTKHDAPLIVDTNTAAPVVVAPQRFKAITGGRAKIAEFGTLTISSFRNATLVI